MGNKLLMRIRIDAAFFTELEIGKILTSYDFDIFTLREKCPNIPDLSVFSPNSGKYGPETTLYLDTFHAVSIS